MPIGKKKMLTSEQEEGGGGGMRGIDLRAAIISALRWPRAMETQGGAT